ncbi:MAG TPA: FkbM family methyltransferase [Rhodocyclaceae bacterium]|nr:FkbM family methyltransferase [Rhodocyclaceae bacterium]
MNAPSNFIKGVITASPQGMYAVNIEDQFIGKSLRETGSYGAGEIELALQHMKPSDRVLVVGSHVGTIAIPLARNCKHVTAIEANPFTYKLLQCNVILNDVKNISTYNFAASDKAEKIRFVMSTVNSGGSKRYPVVSDQMYFYDNPEVVEVDAFSLDKKLARQDYALVFMDIEGSEYFALKGMSNILKKARTLFVEFIPHHLSNVANVTPEDFAAMIEPYFNLVFIPGLNIHVAKENFRAILRRLFDANYEQEQIVFTK